MVEMDNDSLCDHKTNPSRVEHKCRRMYVPRCSTNWYEYSLLVLENLENFDKNLNFSYKMLRE